MICLFHEFDSYPILYEQQKLVWLLWVLQTWQDTYLKLNYVLLCDNRFCPRNVNSKAHLPGYWGKTHIIFVKSDSWDKCLLRWPMMNTQLNSQINLMVWNTIFGDDVFISKHMGFTESLLHKHINRWCGIPGRFWCANPTPHHPEIHM